VSIFKSLTKAALGVVTVPVAVVADAITMGGALADKDKPYTAEACSDIVQNLKDATKPERAQ
jgi:predicted benzoate:H+ symporter BenE